MTKIVNCIGLVNLPWKHSRPVSHWESKCRRKTCKTCSEDLFNMSTRLAFGFAIPNTSLLSGVYGTCIRASILTLICSSMAVAMFMCMSICRFFSRSSGSELKKKKDKDTV